MADAPKPEEAKPEPPALAEKPKAAATKPQPAPGTPDAAAQAPKAEAPKPAPAAKKHEAKSLKPASPAPGALVIDESVEIAAPPEKVWKIFTDEQRWTRWNPVIKSVRGLHGTPWTMGWEFEFVFRNPPLPPVKIRPVLLEVNVPSLVRWFGALPGFSGMHWFLFEKSETGTRATSYEELTGWLTPLLRLFRSRTTRSIRRWLEALKEECEKGAPPASKPLPVVGQK